MISLIAWWLIFKKAGKPGWYILIPFVGFFTVYSIVHGSWVKGFLVLIPIFGQIYAFITQFKLAKVFGKSAAFGIGLIFLAPIFVWILGFGSAKYQGPAI